MRSENRLLLVLLRTALQPFTITELLPELTFELKRQLLVCNYNCNYYYNITNCHYPNTD